MAPQSPADGQRLIAFLRGINVGGHRATKDQLIAAALAAGCTDATTFLASGNLIVETSGDLETHDLEHRLAASLFEELGYAVATFVRSRRHVAEIAAHEPFDGIDTSIGTLQVGFLAEGLSAASRSAVETLSGDIDRLAVHDAEIYWHTAGSIMDSPLSHGSALGRAIDAEVTFRNVTTVRRLAAKFPPA